MRVPDAKGGSGLDGSARLGFGQYESDERISPLFLVPRAHQLSMLTESLMNLTEPSDMATFTPPEVLVDQEFEQIWKNLEASRTSGTMDDEDKAKTEEQLRADYRAIADRRVVPDGGSAAAYFGFVLFVDGQVDGGEVHTVIQGF